MAFTSIKTTDAVRDRLRTLAAERNTTITDLLAELAGRELTAAEHEARARQASDDLFAVTGYRVTSEDRDRARDFLSSLDKKEGQAA